MDIQVEWENLCQQGAHNWLYFVGMKWQDQSGGVCRQCFYCGKYEERELKVRDLPRVWAVLGYKENLNEGEK